MVTGILLAPGLWLLKALTYWGVFRLRSVPATALNCLVIAGAPFLLVFVPLPLPYVLSSILSIGIAIFLTMRYTGVELIPDGLLIPLGIEVVFRIATGMLPAFGRVG